jgi:multisubunit Na+/H+ antiporter MnhE subunit
MSRISRNLLSRQGGVCPGGGGYFQCVLLSGATVLVRAAAFFALWLLLVDNTQQPQLWTGAVVALLAALTIAAVDRLHVPHPRLRLAMLRRAYRPLLLLVTDSARVSWALARMLAGSPREIGRFRAVRYRAVGDDPESIARRVLTEWSASLGPNRYAIGCDPDAGILLVHELVDAGGPLDPLEVG